MNPKNIETCEKRARFIGAELMEIRERMGVSRNQLCQKAGLAYETVRRLEESENFSSIATYLRVAMALSVDFYIVVKRAEKAFAKKR